METKVVNYGWILVEDGGNGYKDYVSVEYVDEDGHRINEAMEKRGNSGCAQAVEWWDKRIGKVVSLQPMLKGSYRVYTMEEE